MVITSMLLLKLLITNLLIVTEKARICQRKVLSEWKYDNYLKTCEVVKVTNY